MVYELSSAGTQPPAEQHPSQPIKPQPLRELFDYAECTNCRHLLPLSTMTDKYFAILSQNPEKSTVLGEKCMRCGADSWILARNIA